MSSKLTRIQLVELKEELKQLAIQIRETKNERRTNARYASTYMKENLRFRMDWSSSYRVMCDAHKDVWKSEGALANLKYDYRHGHIAYCELRGVPREAIERTVASDNKANESEIKRIKDFWIEKVGSKEAA